MTLLPIKSTRNTFPGISVQGSATISQDAFISGSLNANIVGKFPIGDGLDLQHGTLSSTVTGGGGTTTILSGTNIQVGGGTVSVVDSPNFSGTVVSNGIIVLATVTGSSPPAVTFSSPTVEPTIALGITPVGTTQTGATIVYGAFDRYTVASGVSTLLSLSDLFILGNNTASTIRSYNSYEYHITVPLTVDQVKSMPLGSGLGIASGSLYATGGASSGTVSAYEVLSPSNTLTLDVTTGTASATVVSSTLSIVNTQSTSSTTPFQQRTVIDFSSGNLSNYANATLTNIQFSDISGGTIIPSWRESGTVNSGTATYWLKLSQGIPASSTLYVKMNIFTSNQSVLNDTDTGVAPQLPLYYSGTYATNDTGSVMFNELYDNFLGNALSSNFTSTVSLGGSIVVNNGLAMYGTIVDIIASKSFDHPRNLDAYVASHSTSSGATFQMGLSTTSTAISSGNLLASYRGDTYNGARIVQITLAGAGAVESSTTTVPNDESVWTFRWPNTGTQSFTAPNLTLSSTATGVTIANYYPFLAQDQGQSTIQYVRLRAYPPNGVMPSVTQGSVTASTITAVIVFPKDTTFVNGPSTSIYTGSIVGGQKVQVSQYGIANSTSTITNNGAMFGPDSGTTRTGGIQEAINYASIHGIFEVELLFGTIGYDIYDTIKLTGTVGYYLHGQGYHGHTYGGAATGDYSTISQFNNYLVAKTSGMTVLSGQGEDLTGLRVENFSIQGGTLAAIGLDLRASTVSTGRVTLNYNIRDIAVVNCTSYGIMLQATDNWSIENSHFNNLSSGAYDAYFNCQDAEAHVTGCYFQGNGVEMSVQQFAMRSSVLNALKFIANQPTITLEECAANQLIASSATIFDLNGFAVGSFRMNDFIIDLLNGQTWLGGLTGSNKINYLEIKGLRMQNPNDNGIFSNIATLSGIASKVNFQGWQQVSGSPFTNTPMQEVNAQLFSGIAPNAVTTPSFPLISGNIYENINPFTIEVYQPIYFTVDSGTVGYYNVALGSNSSPPIIEKNILETTAPPIYETISLRVPPGWYYSVTKNASSTLYEGTIIGESL